MRKPPLLGHYRRLPLHIGSYNGPRGFGGGSYEGGTPVLANHNSHRPRALWSAYSWKPRSPLGALCVLISNMRPNTSLGPHGRAVPRSLGPPSGRRAILCSWVLS